MKDYLKKRGLDIRQVRRMVHNRSVWRGFVRENFVGHYVGDEPLILTRCHSNMKPLKGGIPSVAKPTT